MVAIPMDSPAVAYWRDDSDHAGRGRVRPCEHTDRAVRPGVYPGLGFSGGCPSIYSGGGARPARASERAGEMITKKTRSPRFSKGISTNTSSADLLSSGEPGKFPSAGLRV